MNYHTYIHTYNNVHTYNYSYLIKYDVIFRVSVDGLIKLRKFPSVPSLLKFFIRNECWISLNAFSASIEMIMQFFFFSLLT